MGALAMRTAALLRYYVNVPRIWLQLTLHNTWGILNVLDIIWLRPMPGGMIDEGAALVQRALQSRRFGPYTLQAAIAAVHAEAPSATATDWRQIVGLYDVLLRADDSPVIALNRAAALAMRDGPGAGLAAIDELFARGELLDYHLAHSARADLCRRLGLVADARASYTVALTLAKQEPERRFLQRRLAELGAG